MGWNPISAVGGAIGGVGGGFVGSILGGDDPTTAHQTATQTTQIAGPSGEEQQMTAMITNQLMPMYMEQMGYVLDDESQSEANKFANRSGRGMNLPRYTGTEPPGGKKYRKL